MRIVCPECEATFVVNPSALGEKGRKVKCARCQHVWFQEPVDDEVQEKDNQLEEATGDPEETESTGSEAESLPEVEEETKETEKEESSSEASEEKSNLPAEMKEETEKKEPAEEVSEKEKGDLVKKLEGILLLNRVNFKVYSLIALFLAIFVYSITASHSLMSSVGFLKGYYHLLGIYQIDGVAMYDMKVTPNIEDISEVNVSGRIQNDAEEIRYLPNLRIQLYDKEEKLLREHFLYSDHQAILPKESIEFQNSLNLPETTHNIVLDIGDWVELARR